jgi:group I intron endonuclease
MRKPGIYRITNTTNGRRYYGSAINLAAREAQHFFDLARGKHHNHELQNDYDEFGRDVLKFEILVICGHEEIRTLERNLIARMQPSVIYNNKTKPRPAVSARNASKRANRKAESLRRYIDDMKETGTATR